MTDQKNSVPVNTATSSQEESIFFFGSLALPILLYALAFAIFLFKNARGIGVFFFAVSSVLLLQKTRKVYQKASSKSVLLLYCLSLAVGLSTFLTDNTAIIILNFIALFLLIVSILLLSFANTTGWDFGDYLKEVFLTALLSVGYIGKPTSDMKAYLEREKNKGKSKTRYVILGILLSVPLVVILAALLSSADLVFARLLAKIFHFNAADVFLFLLLFFFGLYSAYCGIRYVADKDNDFEKPGHPLREPLPVIILSVSVSLLYLLFSLVQFLYLFAGGLQLPSGITYADYARKGFFQLLLVCILNLLFVLLVKKKIQKSRTLDILLLTISCCTFVMIASSALRMYLYIRAYQLTFLRVFVLVALFTLTVLFVGVIIKILHERFDLLRFGVAAIGILYCLFAFSHSEYFIARYNLTHPGVSGEIDTYYLLYNMSADAAPAIVALHQKAVGSSAPSRDQEDPYQEDRDQEDPYQEDGYQENLRPSYEDPAEEMDPEPTWYQDYTERVHRKVSAMEGSPFTFNVSIAIAGHVLR